MINNYILLGKYFIALFILSIPCVFYSQQSVSGYIYDAESKEKLIGANILLSNDKVYSSNGQGYFHFRNEVKSDSFVVSYIGYKKQTVFLKSISEDTLIGVFLKRNELLDEVVITADKVVEHNVNRVKVSLDLLDKTPVL